MKIPNASISTSWPKASKSPLIVRKRLKIPLCKSSPNSLAFEWVRRRARVEASGKIDNWRQDRRTIGIASDVGINMTEIQPMRHLPVPER